MAKQTTYQLIITLRALQAEPYSRYQGPKSAAIFAQLEKRAENGDATAQDFLVGA